MLCEVDSSARDFLSLVDSGPRVVVRYRIEGGFSDALGVLSSRTPTHCVIDTRRGPATVDLTDVVLAKQVPPTPQRLSAEHP
jgi:hypothetical protein